MSIFDGAIVDSGIFDTGEGVAASAAIVGGGGGKRYAYAPPAWWGDEKKKKKLKQQVVEVQKKIEAKRRAVDRTQDIARMQRLIEQITALQKRLLELLGLLDEFNKQPEDEDVIVSYLAHRILH